MRAIMCLRRAKRSISKSRRVKGSGALHRANFGESALPSILPHLGDDLPVCDVLPAAFVCIVCGNEGEVRVMRVGKCVRCLVEH